MGCAQYPPGGMTELEHEIGGDRMLTNPATHSIGAEIASIRAHTGILGWPSQECLKGSVWVGGR
jgi:hypothetical protein